MIILNIAFMADRALAQQLTAWIDENFDTLFAAAMPVRKVEVLEVESDPDYAAQALSLAFQSEWESLEEAREASACCMPFIREALAGKFGDSVMAFATILGSTEISSDL